MKLEDYIINKYINKFEKYKKMVPAELVQALGTFRLRGNIPDEEVIKRVNAIIIRNTNLKVFNEKFLEAITVVRDDYFPQDDFYTQLSNMPSDKLDKMGIESIEVPLGAITVISNLEDDDKGMDFSISIFVDMRTVRRELYLRGEDFVVESISLYRRIKCEKELEKFHGRVQVMNIGMGLIPYLLAKKGEVTEVRLSPYEKKNDLSIVEKLLSLMSNTDKIILKPCVDNSFGDEFDFKFINMDSVYTQALFDLSTFTAMHKDVNRIVFLSEDIFHYVSRYTTALILVALLRGEESVFELKVDIFMETVLKLLITCDDSIVELLSKQDKSAVDNLIGNRNGIKEFMYNQIRKIYASDGSPLSANMNMEDKY